MDAARFASTKRWGLGLLILITLASSSPLYCQTDNNLSEVRRLISEERWQEVVQLAETEKARSVELSYYYGFALARLERLDEAEEAFKQGLKQDPLDKRFLTELAGVAFKQKRYSNSEKYLRAALRLDPEDTYTNDFLASIYFLQGNLEAAIKYWNRVSKPQIRDLKFEPPPKIDPVVLDQAFAFAPSSILHLKDFQTTKARIKGLEIFPNHRLDLEARPEGTFDVVFAAREKSGWGATKWEGVINLLRGLPFETVHPEFFNIRRRAVNSISLIRWDSEKRRFSSNLSGPLSRNPSWRFGLDLDLRDENWDIRDQSKDSRTLFSLNLRKYAFKAGINSIASGSWQWSTGVELSGRNIRHVAPAHVLNQRLFAQGFQLKNINRVNYRIIDLPERRLTVVTSGITEIGRIWSSPSFAFVKLQGSAKANWFPRAVGEDYETQASIRAGKTIGQIPFDELFMLGAERDNHLWQRGHSGTRNGRKGNAPLGRNYLLAKLEVDKNVYTSGLITVKLGPFVDIGKISDSSPLLGSRRWLWDLGGQAKVRVLGLGIAISYGRNLHSHSDALFVSFR